MHRRKKLTTVHLEELYDAKLEEDLSPRTVTGGYLRPQTLYTKYFLPARERVSLPPIHFHDLRHTYATLALLNGVPVKVVSETLGHKDIATALRTYAHVLPGMQKAAGEAMDRVLFGLE